MSIIIENRLIVAIGNREKAVTTAKKLLKEGHSDQFIKGYLIFSSLQSFEQQFNLFHDENLLVPLQRAKNGNEPLFAWIDKYAA